MKQEKTSGKEVVEVYITGRQVGEEKKEGRKRFKEGERWDSEHVKGDETKGREERMVVGWEGAREVTVASKKRKRWMGEGKVRERGSGGQGRSAYRG